MGGPFVNGTSAAQVMPTAPADSPYVVPLGCNVKLDFYLKSSDHIENPTSLFIGVLLNEYFLHSSRVDFDPV